MSRKTELGFFLLFATVLLLPGRLASQPPQQVSGSTPAREFGRAPTDADIYCAGFFTRRPIERGLIVLGSPDVGFKNEFADRDVLYLSKGQGWITAPGGHYMLIRPLKDTNPRESFPGQRKLVSHLGTLYAEIARIQVQILHEGSATAEVLTSCDSIQTGDIAIPWQARPAPPYRSERIVDQFAPASGKTTGVIVAGKEYMQSFGEGSIVYLNLGANQGAQAGGYLRIFRSYLSLDQDVFTQAVRNYPTESMGGPLGRRLSYAERASLPRNVLGEVMVLSVEEDSSTGIITFSREEVSLGDEVELE
ncbi:MAG: hypothetical protein HY647_10905 [Acidobacteria bacterium]|nr:hypothetical protein [Acidobacteriota bacterium]